MSTNRQLTEADVTTSSTSKKTPEQRAARAQKKKKARQKKQQMKQDSQKPEISDEEKIQKLSEEMADFDENEDTSDQAYLELENLVKEYKGIINRVDKYGYTPLSFAADIGDIRLIDILVNAGADINLSDDIGYSPLNRAFLNNDTKCAMHLIQKHNADIRKNDGNGDALYNATLVSNITMMKFLVGRMQKTPDPADRNSFHIALKRAIIEKYAEASYFLIKVLHPGIANINFGIKKANEDDSDKSAVGFVLNLYLLNCPIKDIHDLLSNLKSDDLSADVINEVARKIFSSPDLLRNELFTRIRFASLIVFLDLIQSNFSNSFSADSVKKIDSASILLQKYEYVIGHYKEDFLEKLKLDVRQLHQSDKYDDAVNYYLSCVLSKVLCEKLKKIFKLVDELVLSIEKTGVKSENFKTMVTSLSFFVNSFSSIVKLVCCFDSDMKAVVQSHYQTQIKLSDLSKKREKYEEQLMRSQEVERKQKEKQAIKKLQIQQQKNSRILSAQHHQELKVQEEAKRKAEEEAKRKAEEEAKRKVEEEAKRKVEEEAKRKAEEEAKRKAEDEAKRKAEDEAKRKAKEEAKLKTIEEAIYKALFALKISDQEVTESRQNREQALKPVFNIVTHYNIGALPSLFAQAFKSMNGSQSYLSGGAVVALIRFAREKRALFGLSDFDFIGVCHDTSKLVGLTFKKQENLADLYVSTNTNGYRIEYMNYPEGKFHLYDNALNCDFYACSVAMDEFGNIYDPTGQGLADIKSKTLRAIGDPHESLTNHPVRILRAIRYISQGFTPDLPLERVLKNYDVEKIKFDLNVMSYLRLKLKYYLQNDHDGLYRAALKEYGLWDKFELYKTFPENVSIAVNGFYADFNEAPKAQEVHSKDKTFEIYKRA